MNRPQKYTAYKLEWDFVSHHLSKAISSILGRPIICDTKQEDDNYWSTATIDGTFTIVEIASLVEAVSGDKELYANSLPTDSNTSKSLAMDLCQMLLKWALNVDWEAELISQETLWIIGDFSNAQLENCDS